MDPLPINAQKGTVMRRLYLLGLLLALAGCQNTTGPLGYHKPSRVDDPMLSIPEQESRGAAVLVHRRQPTGAPGGRGSARPDVQRRPLRIATVARPSDCRRCGPWRRFIVFGLFLATLGCQTAPQRAPVPPLPEDTAPLPFVDLVSRARNQAMTALEAYYVDHWPEVEDAARGLEQTARFLRRATSVPATRQADLSVRADALADAAKQLRQGAQSRSVDQVNAVLQRINAQVRELR